MFFPTKPGSEEFGDTSLKEKKFEHYFYNRVFTKLDAMQGPFTITLNEMEIKEDRKAAAPLSGQNLSGSEHENSVQ